ncbi:Rho GTPase activation protein [Mycena albidolilacea]|uniref:Rho GTPase activation protein n=1 Tax=Mycena albidolilacea TaxID=1033008 RepID=A0AAD7F239_9AGAR|nr:Rho GTPase activation protein [Mycena albidolilacea]
MLSEPAQAPSKANLKAWWAGFTSAQKHREGDEKEEPVHTVFGKPLKESLRYASVQISTANANGELYVWGYIPVVVAKCGLYLKENATEVPGTFRVNGSNKRMRELQALFETPPRYGKSLDWKQESYTTHDVASVFRRYLTQMPEPVIPHAMYHAVRDALSKNQSQDTVIATYKRLIRAMPRANQYLLLYVLDLLSVFARKADKNLMTATNLAVIFRPGLISHPAHEMSPAEHDLSQRVLEFLIAQQDWFMLDIPPPPQHGPGGPGSSDEWDDEVLVDDEGHSPVGGAWNLVPGAASGSTPGMPRRKTTDSRTPPDSTIGAGDLSPVNETEHGADGAGGSASVTRRRTLPSGRRGAGAEGGGGAGTEHPTRPKVLRKQKRSSSTQPRVKEKERESSD